MKQIEVVAAIIHDEQNRIFATQRGYGDWKDYWEFPGGKMEPGVTSNFESTFLAKVNRQIFAEDFCAHIPVRSAHTSTTVALIPVPRRSGNGPQKPPLKEHHQQEEKEQQDRIVESSHKHNDADCKNGGYDDHERSWSAVVTGLGLIVLLGVVLHIGVDLMQRYTVMGVILLFHQKQVHLSSDYHN